MIGLSHQTSNTGKADPGQIPARSTAAHQLGVGVIMAVIMVLLLNNVNKSVDRTTGTHSMITHYYSSEKNCLVNSGYHVILLY